MDGVDFPIVEPSPFSSKWYSHKFHGPGLRYDIGVAVGTGHFVWAFGPFPCGSYNELAIYRMARKRHLDLFERVVADGGYQDDTCSRRHPKDNVNWSFVRARHEAANKRPKQFKVLSHRFRHDLRLHSSCFFAVANITQVLIRLGEPIFHVY